MWRMKLLFTACVILVTTAAFFRDFEHCFHSGSDSESGRVV